MTIPYIDAAAIANETRSDLWLHIPRGATDDHARAMGAFCGDAANLDVDCRVVLNSEYRQHGRYGDTVAAARRQAGTQVDAFVAAFVGAGGDPARIVRIAPPVPFPGSSDQP